MHCFPCFSSPKNKKSSTTNETNDNDARPPERRRTEETEQSEGTTLKTFTFRELATATKNFRQECLLGEGGFGRVYKGTLKSTGQVVAVKQLDKHGLHGNKEFQAEVLSLGQLDHPNLVKLIGYCADGDQRLLVYDYITGGSLQDHLHDREPLGWTTRMQIAYGVAQGLEYLHDKANPPVIYRDLKASNILLDDDFFPKLSDFGLHKLGPGTGDKIMALSSRVMGTYGYSAPEYTRGGNLTMKSDVYSFGVVLLELITGRGALDTTRPNDEQNLVSWAQPIFRDPKRYPDMADPVLEKKFSERGLNQAVAIASMCVQEEAAARPLISDVMVALSFLSMPIEDGIPTAVPILSFKDKSMSIALSRHDSNLVSPPPEVAIEDDKSSTSSSEESSLDSETESVSKKKYKKNHEEEDSAMESFDGSDSNSEHEKGQDSPPPKRIDEKNPAQSLKIKYRYSWEDIDVSDERLSSKSSQKSSDESTSSHYDSDRDHDLDLPRKEEKEKEEEEDEEHTHLEHVHSSKTDDDQSDYFDNDDDSRDDDGASLQRIESEVENDSVEDDNGGSLHRIKSEVKIDSVQD